jgi:hypothetical protein
MKSVTYSPQDGGCNVVDNKLSIAASNIRDPVARLCGAVRQNDADFGIGTLAWLLGMWDAHFLLLTGERLCRGCPPL